MIQERVDEKKQVVLIFISEASISLNISKMIQIEY